MVSHLSAADQRGLVARQANERGLTVGGVPVLVYGSGDFARVAVKSPHPLSGFSAEYSWEAIARATRDRGVLR